MTKQRPQDDGFDGVRVTAHPRRARWWLLLVAFVAAGAGWWWLDRQGSAPDAVPDRNTARQRASASAVGGGPMEPAPIAAPRGSVSPRAAALTGADGEDPTPDLSDYVLPGEAPRMEEVIHALHARGIRTGLGAFSPPGTSPPLEGLEVPADFALPEGYVRHHQATDDGQPIAPILMFAPDLDAVVVNGVRVPVPADRVVPPELAPPGLPLRRVRIPPPLDAGSGP